MGVSDARGARRQVLLIDTNAIIESVRTKVWNSLTGHLSVETVTECHAEAQRGNHLRPDYVRVPAEALARLAAVHAVTELERLELEEAYPDASGMDDGERDLFAHAFQRAKAGDEVWVVCSPDIASVRAAVALGWEDRIVSLDVLVRAAGARPASGLDEHYLERWLSQYRTRFLLDRGSGAL